jgi:small subunit ribosomal protein S24e
MRKTVGYAKIYDDADHAKSVEQGHALKRNKIAAEESGDDAEPEAEEA